MTFGCWKQYPSGFFSTSAGVDEARSWAVAAAAADGFGGDHPEVIFIPRTHRYINGGPIVDVVGWRVRSAT